ALAPMSEWNDLAFVSLAREYGADLIFLGLVSAEGLARKNLKTRSLLRYTERARPIFAQIFGSDPQSMGEAAKIVEDMGFDGLDINAGCPVSKVTRTGSGAALMENLKNAQDVVKSVRKAVKIPVTIKMRLGPTGAEHLKLAAIAEEEGLDAVILHPRTPRQGYSGKADWTKVAELKAVLSIPVFASGDVRDGVSFLEVLQSTGCDGVLIGRGALGNPWIFRECRYALARREFAGVKLE
ncbi:MAG: tRNA dihydrouridine synthase, partial [bacterium]